MGRILGSIGATLLFASSAFAADLPVKAPPLAAAPSWTGWYIGATAGYGWTNKGIDDTASTFCNSKAVVPAPVPAVAVVAPPPNPCPAFGNALAAALPTHFSTDPKGFIGGGEIGYNAQFGRIVVGVEADISGADIKGSDAQTLVSPVAGFPLNTVRVDGSASEKLDFFATLRARAGYTLMPQLLAYATGGFAFGHVSASTSLTETVTGPCGGCTSQTVAASASATLPGWTVGGGLEWMLAPNWTVKGEYLYYDLGTLSYALPGISQAIAVPGFTAVFGANNINSTATVKGNIARIGVNYRF